MNTNDAVGYVLGLIKVAFGIGNIDARHPFGTAKEGLRGRVIESGPVDVDVVIVKTERQWRRGYTPDAIVALCQRKALSHPNDNGLRLGRIDSERRLAFGVYFWIFKSR